jgi:hypothetical protein
MTIMKVILCGKEIKLLLHDFKSSQIEFSLKLEMTDDTFEFKRL